MNNIREILEKYTLIPKKYTIRKNATIIDANDGHFVFKRKSVDGKMEDLFKYLKSRSFTYLPSLVKKDDRYDVYEYIEEIDTPREQKALDMMNVVSVLHYKTTYFKDVNEDDYKEIYEDINRRIEYIRNYYNDIITTIEEEVYMSPSHYLIARNISKVFNAINFCEREIEHWYELVKEKHKKRIVTLHNNLDLDHLIRNDDFYLISWDRSKQDMPILDLYDFYKRYALEFDFEELFNQYENKYKLFDDERLLLFIMISLPDKINFDINEMSNCSKARKVLDYIYKTENLLTPYYMPNDTKQ
jgi:hypothetical protein